MAHEREDARLISTTHVNPGAVGARGLSTHTHWLNKISHPLSEPKYNMIAKSPCARCRGSTPCMRCHGVLADDNDEDGTVNSEGEHEASHERFVYAHVRGGERAARP